jgi:transcriptional regulator with XRE-family HTH domain
MNENELRAEIARSGLTMSELAERIGISKSAMHRKVSGITEFRQSELAAIKIVLGLTDRVMARIFFAEKVS